MRKRIVALIHRRLIHLKQSTMPPRRSTRRSTERDDTDAPRGGALAAALTVALPISTPITAPALPAHSSALKDLLASIEEHVELGVTDDAALARGGALHD